jgi:hypothetical protein
MIHPFPLPTARKGYPWGGWEGERVAQATEDTQLNEHKSACGPVHVSA